MLSTLNYPKVVRFGIWINLGFFSPTLTAGVWGLGCLKANTLMVLKCFNSRTHFPPHQEPGEERPLLLATGSLMRETLSRPGSVPPASGKITAPVRSLEGAKMHQAALCVAMPRERSLCSPVPVSPWRWHHSPAPCFLLRASGPWGWLLHLGGSNPPS